MTKHLTSAEARTFYDAARTAKPGQLHPFVQPVSDGKLAHYGANGTVWITGPGVPNKFGATLPQELEGYPALALFAKEYGLTHAEAAPLPFTDVPGLTRWLQDQMGAFDKLDDFVLVIGDDQYRALQRMLEAAQHFPAGPVGYERLQGVQLARVRPPCFRLAQWKDTTE